MTRLALGVVVVLLGIVLYKWKAWAGAFNQSLSEKTKSIRQNNVDISEFCAETIRQVRDILSTETYPPIADDRIVEEMLECSRAISDKAIFCSAEVRASSDLFHRIALEIKNQHKKNKIQFHGQELYALNYLFTSRIFEYALTTDSPKKPPLFENQSSFRKELSGYIYGEHKDPNHVDYIKLQSHPLSHVLVSIFNTVLQSKSHNLFELKRLFFISTEVDNHMLLFDMQMRGFAAPLEAIIPRNQHIPFQQSDTKIKLYHCVQYTNFENATGTISKFIDLYYSPINDKVIHPPANIKSAVEKAVAPLNAESVTVEDNSRRIVKVRVPIKNAEACFRREQKHIRYLLSKAANRNLITYMAQEWWLLLRARVSKLAGTVRAHIEKKNQTELF